MNRLRLLVLAGVVIFGGLGSRASSARAQAPGAPAAPRYFYGLGPNGYGYYYYPAAPAPAPAAAPTYRGGFYSPPARSYSRSPSTGRTAQDYTGRHDGLARPWLQPLR